MRRQEEETMIKLLLFSAAQWFVYPKTCINTSPAKHRISLRSVFVFQPDNHNEVRPFP